jgi:hypothetical protein
MISSSFFGMEKELYFFLMGLEKQRAPLWWGWLSGLFEWNFGSHLFSKESVLAGLLNVELWKYIQEAQLSSNDEPLR